MRAPNAAFVFGDFSILADRRDWKDLCAYFNPEGIFAAVHVISCGDDYTYPTLRFGSVHVHPVRSLTTFWRLRRLNDLYVLARGTRLLDRLVQEHDIDLVAQIDATPVKYGLPVIKVARKHGLPSIVTLCSDYDAAMTLNASTPGRWAQRMLWPYVLRRATKVRSKGHHIAGFARRYGVPEEDIEVIPNKEVLGKFRSRPSKGELTEAAARWGIRDWVGRGVILVTCGRLIEAKNVERMLRGVALARSRGLDLNYLIVGTGPLRQKLEETAEALSIGAHVKFLGYLSHEELRLAYRIGEIFLFATLFEGQPRALLEAMLSGLPVITSRHGAVRELVGDGRDALLVDPLSIDEIARAIERLARSPELRRQLGSHPAFDPKLYSHEAVSTAEAAFYRQTLEEYRTRASTRAKRPDPDSRRSAPSPHGEAYRSKVAGSPEDAGGDASEG